MKTKQHVGTGEAARFLGVTDRRIRQLIDEGTLDAEKIGDRCWLIRKAELKRVKRLRSRTGKAVA